ncbi:STAS-like domain-containing protein (plasmid) [Leptospira sp. WS60.C2]
MINIDVGNDFYFRLANRNKFQGDGKYTAEEFRKKYLIDLENEDFWKESTIYITLDFKNVKKIGPSFANEAFAYFMKFTDPKSFLKRVSFKNCSEVQLMIISKELNSGYSK